MTIRRKIRARAAAVLALLTAVPLMLQAAPASADDQCIQRCIQLENQCRKQSKGQGNCDQVAAQCMASCRQPK